MSGDPRAGRALVDLLARERCCCRCCHQPDNRGRHTGPSDYGLARRELVGEARRLHRRGWTPGEIDRVLVTPDAVPEQGWCA